MKGSRLVCSLVELVIELGFECCFCREVRQKKGFFFLMDTNSLKGCELRSPKNNAQSFPGKGSRKFASLASAASAPSATCFATFNIPICNYLLNSIQ